MFRSHTCGQLRMADINTEVTLAGWVQTVRKFGSITFVDLRDRYGITQLLFNESLNTELDANPLGREFVLQVKGKVSERSNKNLNIPTGEIEIEISSFSILNKSITPPFTIQDDTDGGDELRMKYRFLDLRRNAVKKNLELRYAVGRSTRNYLHENNFMDIETPFLIKSTPEGARDFVVPSRMNAGQFYALPQSPQTFKQLLMVSGYDRYYQIVKCFRDEDLRADRQPEFTQIDCEMCFVEQEDILQMFEGLVRSIFKDVKNIDYSEVIERMTWEEAMWTYGNDKPDIRFGIQLNNLKFPAHTFTASPNPSEGGTLAENKAKKYADVSSVIAGDFAVFNDAETVVAICIPNCSDYSRKQTDELVEWVKRPQIGMKGLAFIKCNADGTFKSSIDKFYTEEQLKNIAATCHAVAGDLILIVAGAEERTRKAASDLRMEMASRLFLRVQKFGLNIVNRTSQLNSNKQIYSMRINLTNNNMLVDDNLINTIRSATNKSPDCIQAFEINNGKITIHFEANINSNTSKFEDIVKKNKNNLERKGHHFFIFIEKESFAFSLLNEIRNKIGTWYELNQKDDFKLLWVMDFPLFEYAEEDNRWVARHHPFTSPKPSDIDMMINNNPKIENAAEYLKHPYANIKANAYDMVLNGNEIGGGSIRIYQKELQQKMFAALGMDDAEQQHKFGFLLGAFEYGAPPHGGIAFGFDRLCSILGGSESIRDFIAFPKNNSGRDVMIDAPSTIDDKQFEELQIKLDLKD
jgi:aspartyl-tRNA synthetase